ncbi:MAG: cardiolipin synthase B [Gammaproteobacteria bacterium]|nr:cardiolipin synthase B [Gammaproteobacteria bacterium]
MSSKDSGTSSRASRTPAEARAWLNPRVRKQQLYRLAPRAPKLRLGVKDRWDHARSLMRAWVVWLALAVLLEASGLRGFAIATGLLSFVLYHVTPRVHPAVYAVEASLPAGAPEFALTVAGMTGMPLVPGNRVEILQNGDAFYPAMLTAIQLATRSITLEQYIFWRGRVGLAFAEALAERARHGVAVKVLVDAIGSSIIGEEILATLEAGGVELAWFRPIHWYTLNRATLRTHRKSLIVDGRVAFTGGAGLADQWIGRARGPQEWRDTCVLVEGPAVHAQQSGFAQNWMITTGEMLSGDAYFPLPRGAGRVAVQTILSSPLGGAGAGGTMYLLALQCATRSIHIANPYFIPQPTVVQILREACRRGVNVQLMIAGAHIDSWWARYNSLRLYGRLLEAGVEIYEYQTSMLHQKTMVIDGEWATVGTANLDNRSFALNEETNLCFDDPELVAELEAVFAADLTACERIDHAAWHGRGRWRRMQEAVASLIEDQV